MNFKTLILLSLILLGGICTGCDRFLDVQPKDQYNERQEQKQQTCLIDFTEPYYILCKYTK